MYLLSVAFILAGPLASPGGWLRWVGEVAEDARLSFQAARELR